MQDDRIPRLYQLGNQLNWNARLEMGWNQTPAPSMGTLDLALIDEFLAQVL